MANRVDYNANNFNSLDSIHANILLPRSFLYVPLHIYSPLIDCSDSELLSSQLGFLPLHYRIFIVRELCNIKYKDIAELYGVSVKSVSVAYSRIKRKVLDASSSLQNLLDSQVNLEYYCVSRDTKRLYYCNSLSHGLFLRYTALTMFKGQLRDIMLRTSTDVFSRTYPLYYSLSRYIGGGSKYKMKAVMKDRDRMRWYLSISSTMFIYNVLLRAANEAQFYARFPLSTIPHIIYKLTGRDVDKIYSTDEKAREYFSLSLILVNTMYPHVKI